MKHLRDFFFFFPSPWNGGNCVTIQLAERRFVGEQRERARRKGDEEDYESSDKKRKDALGRWQKRLFSWKHFLPSFPHDLPKFSLT